MLHTPITAFYGGLLGITFMYLSILVIKGRRSAKISLGDGGNSHFLGIIRAHANFAEYVPLILILMLIAEIETSFRGKLATCFWHAINLRRAYRFIDTKYCVFVLILCLF